MSVQQINRVAYGLSDPLLNVFPAPIISNRAPTTADKAQLGTGWINITLDDYYVLTSIVANSANWQQVVAGAGAVNQLTSDAGVAVPVAGNINIVGGTNIGTTGAGSSITINTDAAPTFGGLVTAGGGFLASGGNIVAATGNISSTLGSVSAATSVSAGTTGTFGTGLTVTTGDALISTGNVVVTSGSGSFNTTVTAGTTLVGTLGLTVSAFTAGVAQTDALGVFSSTKGTDGQILISSTAGVPAWATLTAGTNITITNAANSITIDAMGGATVLSIIQTAVTPYVALPTDNFIAVDCSAAIKTVQLPDAPATGRVFTVKDYTGSAAAFNITVTTVSGVVLIDNAATFVMNTNYQSLQVIFDGTKYEIY